MDAARVNLLTISSLKEQAGEQPLVAFIDCELQSRSLRQTKAGKPYLVLTFADATGSFNLNAWSDAPLYDAASGLPDGTVIRLDAQWTQNQYGVNAANIAWERLSGDELETFFAGDAATAEKQRRDWETIRTFCSGIRDPRLHALAEHFITDLGAKFRRAAAARKNHLMIAGVLFHDCGKLWENQYPERGFGQGYTLHGEMLGHIPLGIELVNKLWRDVADAPEAKDWLPLEPPSETVRLHLLHLIASHHGELQFGSPTLPRTPEAFALHYIDNLDAKLEMVKDAYTQANELAEGIYEKQFPLPANLVEPLPSFGAPASVPGADEA